jgi:SET domain
MFSLVFFIVGTVCLLLAYLLYGLATRRGLVEPNCASWLIWGATTAVEALTYNAVNQGEAQNFIFLLSALACVVITAAVWQQSVWKKPSRAELACIVVCLVSLVVWLVFQNAIWAHVLILAAIPVSFLPTWIGLRRHPQSEQSPAWGLWTMGDIATLCLILMSPKNNGEDLPYILIEGACHASVWMMAGWGTIDPSKTFHIKRNKIFTKTTDLDSGHRFLVGRTHVGKAVYAGQAFHNGQSIVLFRGPICHRRDLPTYMFEAQDRFFQISRDYFMGPSGNVDDLMNHSCDPNAGLRFTAGGPVLIALRDIGFGEELTWDYSTTILNHNWVMACQCGSPSCRGSIGEFHNLPVSKQRAYAELGILPSYILETLVESRA